MDLVILAAGLGSRFGGLKQVEPIDEWGNFIIDYSIWDAKEAGFDRVVFVIRKEHLDIFKDSIGKRLEGKIAVEYVFQDIKTVPAGIEFPADRTKPLGTAQAIYCCKDVVKGSFAMINADDYYGKDALKVAGNFLKSLPEGSKGKYSNVGYMAKNTMTDNGSVKRGVLVFDENNNLKELIESKLEFVDGKIEATPLEGDTTPRFIASDSLVSMNLFCYTNEIFDAIEKGFSEFVANNQGGLDKCEYLIPSITSELIEKGEATCKVLSTSAVWYGFTYREDKPAVVAAIKQLVDNGDYPAGLFQAK